MVPTNRKFGELSENSLRARNKLTIFLKRTIIGGAQDDMSNWVQDKIFYDRHLKRVFVSLHHHLTSVGSEPSMFMEHSVFDTDVNVGMIRPFSMLLPDFGCPPTNISLRFDSRDNSLNFQLDR